MRNDAMLITGLSSAVDRKQEYARKQLKEAKQSKAAKIRPHMEIINEEIKKLRDEIAAEIGNIVHVEMKPETVIATVIGLRLADSKVTSLASRLKHRLGTK